MAFKSKLTFVFFIAASLVFSSCFFKKEAEPIVFDNSEPAALLPDVKWAVVKDSYSAFHSEPDWESPVNSYCRCGQICRIIGNRSTVNSSGISETWLKVESGWISQNAVVICSNRYNAQTVSDNLTR